MRNPSQSQVSERVHDHFLMLMSARLAKKTQSTQETLFVKTRLETRKMTIMKLKDRRNFSRCATAKENQAAKINCLIEISSK